MRLELGEDFAETRHVEIWRWCYPPERACTLRDFGVAKVWEKPDGSFDAWGTYVHISPVRIFHPPLQILRDALHDLVPW